MHDKTWGYDLDYLSTAFKFSTRLNYVKYLSVAILFDILKPDVSANLLYVRCMFPNHLHSTPERIDNYQFSSVLTQKYDKKISSFIIYLIL